MNMPRRVLFLGVALLVAVAIAVACSRDKAGPPSASDSPLSWPTNGAVQSSSGGGVTLDVEWRGVEKDSLVFKVAMDTHSVDLDSYDLGEMAVLRDDAGREYRPSNWLSSPGGHHREGTLAFGVPDGMAQGKARYLKLVVRDVAGVRERVLGWELE